MSNPRRYDLRSKLCACLGTLMVITGSSVFFTWECFLDHLIKSEIILKEDSQSFILWRDTPIPMFMNFYFFNWTNPGELGEVKPNLIEMGPYRFNMKETKTNISWNENGTITYQIARRWYFDPVRSKGNLDDVVTTLNAVAMSAANTVRYWNKFLRKSFSVSLTTTSQTIHIRQKVGDLLFNGYSDPLLEIAAKLPSFAGIDIPYDKFGWFYLRNTSSDFEGIFNMDTGARGHADFGKLWKWNYDKDTGFYDGTCGRVNGSAGELFPPFQTKSRPLHMFSADLCRTIKLDYKEETEISGVKGYKYSGGAWNFDNGTLDPVNECFCGGECPYVGALNVTSCRFGAPGFVSYPHFLHGDQYYLDQVSGLDPNEDKHTLYISLEPRTGIPLDVAARFQINILLSSVPGITLFEKVPKIFFPMMWFEQKAGISSELANELNYLLHLPQLGRLVCVIIAVIGFFITTICLCLFCGPENSDTDKKPNETIMLTEGTVKPLIIPMSEKDKNGVKDPMLKLHR